MKKLMLLFATVLWISFSNAAILTVDNTPGSAAAYNTITAAVAAANAGDTILIYGSSYGYAAFTIDKQLVVAGSAAVDPEVSNESRPSISYISFGTGSSGSVVSGLNVGYMQAYAVTVNNIGIYNNYFTSTTTGVQWYSATSSNWIIEGNVFIANGNNPFIDNYSNTSTLNNILVKNNYFEMLNYYYYIGSYNNSAFTYRNNVFILRSSSGYMLCYSCSNTLFENNIFWVTTAAYTDITGASCTNCVFNNNIIYNSGGGTMIAINSIGNGVSGNNNIMNTDPTFVNFVEADNYTIAEDYRLAGGSPGENAGTDGSDIGLYGGNYNWENRKYPKAFPHQEIFNVINSSVPQGQPININLKAKKAAN